MFVSKANISTGTSLSVLLREMTAAKPLMTERTDLSHICTCTNSYSLRSQRDILKMLLGYLFLKHAK